MINFVVVSHNKKLAQEAINLAKTMKFANFEIINAGGLRDSEEYGSDASLILEAIEKAKKDNHRVLIFCELGSSLINSQMAIEMANDKNVYLADGPFVESLIVATSTNNTNCTIEKILEEIKKVKNYNKTIE